MLNNKVIVDLTSVSTYELMEALMDRKDVEYVVNERSSSDYAVAVDFKRTVLGSGEATILICKGAY